MTEIDNQMNIIKTYVNSLYANGMDEETLCERTIEFLKTTFGDNVLITPHGFNGFRTLSPVKILGNSITWPYSDNEKIRKQTTKCLLATYTISLRNDGVDIYKWKKEGE